MEVGASVFSSSVPIPQIAINNPYLRSVSLIKSEGQMFRAFFSSVVYSNHKRLCFR